ncbi:bifunctional biotin--[acetyl-CoA-carboxylase] ligase/biotin operon repressor BirA [Pseudomonas sp. GD03842]|uniref:bifunctional biotin--[acetyl-CoA-carboxylase] ligase/biotin operon repressor BirA n=1 Tax=unclassified Pseudomonas TaxID=196821 RepID=UPI000D39E021|nr:MULTISPECIES: bifunctional biotin--[acetyl-CoA-carboxylase] ligase/biotin operon repressor BirA [unclassified Pseudomonas]MDH0749011.1 bifunctional biotin--[acetyl-CoA-carboxylase] ligase/biotin operon repressor BirA [Pseudomonas sp. GD03842]RAU39883.1 bifunctional biotin--[acetyl-CoA-carboxylase] ligase/biotin operon repressor BirA [Pseudomonas sp. RIT 409]RAU46682.1 bifunctional biotin--[acetyl-CoA-carboxylase] ligase/biotin operon repressor BirA [Pseudomonas sp. RIT 412]
MQRLLRLLSDGEFHSGEDLGRTLGVSRSAVWKRLQQLQDETGLEIHKVRGRGYRLASPLHVLDLQRLSAAHRGWGWTVHVHDVIDSTNAEAMRLVAAGAPLPALVLSEQQTAGRGRRGRKWISPYAENLYYSLALRIDGGMRQLEGLSLLVGLAVVNTLREMGVERAGLKWPNDILAGGKKLAGILLELTGDPADVCHVVIGIGINVNMRTAQEVDQAWTSMRLETGIDIDRNEVSSRLSSVLNPYLEVHGRSGFAAFKDEWERHHLWQGCPVTLLAGSTAVDGMVVGVDAVGALRLEVEGEVRTFSGGELSLRLRN